MVDRTVRMWCWMFLAVLFAWKAEAQPRPSSDLLLPYFEVGIADAGVTTLLAVSNDLDKPVDVLVTVSSNWGVPVLSVPLKLKAHEIWTGDLREWLASGDAPGVTLNAADLLHLQAALSGEPSPRDGLYYSAATTVDRATGSISLRTLGTPRPAALEGQFFLIDPGQGTSQGERLADVSTAAAPAESCSQHTVRQIAGGAPGGSRLILGSALGGQPLPAADPQDRRLPVTLSAYSAAGALLKRQTLKLLPAAAIAVADLGLTQALGRLELATPGSSVVGVRAAGNTVWTATCAQGPPPASQPKIQIVTLVNGKRATSPPGPSIAVGEPVVWTYTVTNAGAGNLNQVRVTDSAAGAVKCPQKALRPGQSMTCSRSGVAEGCQHSSTATAAATGARRIPVSSQDKANYFGADGSEVEIAVSTNGQDADVPPGPSVQAGSPVSWTYRVTNAGTVRLYQILVQDDQGVAVSCPRVSLGPGEAMTCTASGPAVPGQYSNVGKVTATGTCGKVTASNPSHYFGESSLGLDLQTLTNGFDADTPPGPSIPVGNPVTWQYLVTNTGKLTVSSVAVSDDHGTAVSCPLNALPPGQSMTCIARGVAAACQYTNLGTATGQTSEGPVSASDASNYFGQSQASLTMRTYVNGQAADQPPGPTVVTGSSLQWTYTVTNTGQATLTGLRIADDRGAVVTCPQASLPPGQSTTCTAAGTALSGSYVSHGVVSGTTSCGSTVTASAAAAYVGAGDSGLQIQTLVNGQNANKPPGPSIPVGGAVAWSYAVTNTGQIPLSRVSVSDSLGNFITCPQTSLAPGATMTCSSEGTARSCQASDLGTATAQTPAGQAITAVDPAYYFGQAQPALQIQVATNGVSASAAPGPTIQVGSAVTWTYTVVNAGDVALTQVQVSDGQGAAVTCPATSLAPGESMRCTAHGTAIDGQYQSAATVTGAPPCGSQASAQGLVYYLGSGDGAIQLRKLTAGQATPTAPGPTIPLGSPVTWTYMVTNSGRVALSNVGVTDNQGVVVTCPRSTLQPGETMSCIGTGTAQACQYDNLGIATGMTAGGQQVNGVDQGFYFGRVRAEIDLQMTVNGQAAPTAPGPTLPVGATVAWSYLVTNPGNVPLSSVRVLDGRGAAVTCPQTSLQPGMQMTCTATGPAIEGQFDDTATVAAASPCGDTITAQDSGHYLGRGTPGLQIQTLLNAQDVPQSPGPSLTVGTPILWSYTVSNVGQASLSGLVVTDDRGSNVTCQRTSLQPGESTACTAISQDTAQACTQVNLGKATAQSGSGPITAFDPSFYVGQFQAALQMQMTVNGVQAPAAPGPGFPVGALLTWAYHVTNLGNAPLTNLKIQDSQGAAVGSCLPNVTTLNPGQSMTCTATGQAVNGQFQTTGTATADPPCGSLVSAQDTSYYLGQTQALPGLQIQTLLNGQDVAQSPGPSLTVGIPVLWSYTVSNVGQTGLSDLAVTDDRGSDVSCQRTSLLPGESTTCTAIDQDTAQACAQVNVGRAVAQSGSGPITAFDSSFYVGQFQAALQMQMTVNGVQATAAPGPTLAAGDDVSWTYQVTNLGNVRLTGVTVQDSQGADVDCTSDTLDPNQSMTCTANGTAVGGQFQTTGTVTANPPCGSQISAQDTSYYYGQSEIRIQIRKLLNGQHYDNAPGPLLAPGSPIAWSYIVSNPSTVTLQSIVVGDDKGVAVTCPGTSLAPGASMICTGSSTSQSCPYHNVGTVTGVAIGGVTVTDSDDSYYTGSSHPGVTIKTYVVTPAGDNDANVPPGPTLHVGDSLQWKYVVTNTGDVQLTNVVVTDGSPTPSCPKNILAPQETMTCTRSGVVAAGAHTNTGTVKAAPPCGDSISAKDASNYFGATPGISITDIRANGAGAIISPGPGITAQTKVSWTYSVKNTGNIALSGIGFTDDKGFPISCPGSSLQPSQTMTCTADGGAAGCDRQAVVATVTANSSGGAASASRTGYYTGTETGALSIRTDMILPSIFGSPSVVDCDTPPGPGFSPGTVLHFRHTVTNTVDVPLTGVTLSDALNGCTNAPTTLAPRQSFTCEYLRTISGVLQQNNAGTISGRSVCGKSYSNTNNCFYVANIF